MRRAIELAGQSVEEGGRTRPSPRVGAVLVRDGLPTAEGYRGATGDGDHAEYGILKKLRFPKNLNGATLYTTLEPCTKRRHQEFVPCAKRLADAHVSTVVIGMFDPDPGIHQDGWRILHDAGVMLRDFPADLRDQIAGMNVPFIEQYKAGRGDTGSARFDYTQNDGLFPIDTTTVGAFGTRWSGASGVAIWAYDQEHGVALARYATAFDQIDDPSAYTGTRVVAVGEGQICIFRNEVGWLLVVVEDVMAPDRGDDRWEVTISWEARGPDVVADPRSDEAGT